MKRRNNQASIAVLLLSLFVIAHCGDSLKSRLIKRLNNFKDALPENIRIKFNNGEYLEAGRMLDDKLNTVKTYIDKFNDEEKKKQFIRGDYSEIQQEIKKMEVSKELLDFNRRFYKIVDYECIPAFTGSQTVDFFKVYFKEKLDSMK